MQMQFKHNTFPIPQHREFCAFAYVCRRPEINDSLVLSEQIQHVCFSGKLQHSAKEDITDLCRKHIFYVLVQTHMNILLYAT